MAVRLISCKQEIAEVREAKFVVLFLRPLNRGASLLRDNDLLTGTTCGTSRIPKTFDLVVRVETLVGDGVPSFVRTFVNQSFRVQFALQYREKN